MWIKFKHQNRNDITLAGSSVEGSNQDEDAEWKNCKPYTGNILHGSDTSSSNDFEESSESALQLLLDIPSNNDMSFLGQSDTYSMYPGFLSESCLDPPKIYAYWRFRHAPSDISEVF